MNPLKDDSIPVCNVQSPDPVIAQSLKKGTTLRNVSYRIERILGQGGFGITYLATDLDLDRKVAIKEFFPKDFCDREEETSHVTLGTRSSNQFVTRLKAKFLKEARNIAKFDHPGIIKIHAAFEENNTAYYVMDYIEGTSLSGIVKSGGPLTESKALEYIFKIGNALEYVHGHRMNHLDVKPANIMVRASDDMPILIDFGLSKRYDSEGNQTSTTPTGISHGYAPIEQYSDGGLKEFSPQTDLYSLAATLYFTLTGTVPPQATKLVDEGLAFPRNISPQLISPINKAMSYVRKHRHESVGDFLRELTSAEDEETTILPTPTPNIEKKPAKEKTIKPLYKDKLMLMLIMVIVIVALVGFTIWWMLGDRNDLKEVDAVWEEVPKRQSVTDMYWESPLGIASYTGEVAPDSVNLSGKMIPHGQGIARISGGEYDGSIYDGEFIQGRMEGKATYTLKNGDIFIGTFKDNGYEKGRYTINATGAYFDGTFKNGATDKGDWYDKK